MNRMFHSTYLLDLSQDWEFNIASVSQSSEAVVSPQRHFWSSPLPSTPTLSPHSTPSPLPINPPFAKVLLLSLNEVASTSPQGTDPQPPLAKPRGTSSWLIMAMASSNRDVPGFVAWQVSSKETQLAGELAAIKHSLKFGSLSLGLGGGPGGGGPPESSLSHSDSISSELITLHSHKLPPAIAWQLKKQASGQLDDVHDAIAKAQTGFTDYQKTEQMKKGEEEEAANKTASTTSAVPAAKKTMPTARATSKPVPTARPPPKVPPSLQTRIRTAPASKAKSTTSLTQRKAATTQPKATTNPAEKKKANSPPKSPKSKPVSPSAPVTASPPANSDEAGGVQSTLR